MVKTQYQADPSAVCFDAHRSAIQNKVDFLICDTAGRLHTRDNLMEELKKIQRTLKKQDESAPHERLLVVDATTGSNALSQAKKFQEHFLDDYPLCAMDLGQHKHVEIFL